VTQADPRVDELSERDLLRAVLDRLGPSRAVVGPGDDAAVLVMESGRIVATVDTLVHGPDFRLAWTTGRDLGWKAAAVNLADVAAMGARPTALLVALTLPEDTRLSFVTGIAEGLRDACTVLAPDAAVEGGDLTVSDTLTVAVTALGTVDAGTPVVTRSGARPGDAVIIAGSVGLADMGLRILFDRFRDAQGHPVPISPGILDDAERAAVAAQLRPSPPIALGPRAARAGVTAMMDVSDGLALDASRLAEASGVTIELDPAALGDDPARALEGGEDHGLLATLPEGAPLPSGFRRIGRVRERGPSPVTIDGLPYRGRAGWDPYRDWDSARG